MQVEVNQIDQSAVKEAAQSLQVQALSDLIEVEKQPDSPKKVRYMH